MTPDEFTKIVVGQVLEFDASHIEFGAHLFCVVASKVSPVMYKVTLLLDLSKENPLLQPGFSFHLEPMHART